jgi:hypothetical protein
MVVGMAFGPTPGGATSSARSSVTRGSVTVVSGSAPPGGIGTASGASGGSDPSGSSVLPAPAATPPAPATSSGGS